MTDKKNISAPRKVGISDEILENLKNGSHEAFEMVYYGYSKSLLHFLSLLLSSEEEGEEVMQEVFITVWEKRALIEPAKGFTSYLFTIAKNAAFKHMSRKRTISMEEGFYGNSDLPDNTSPEENVVVKDTELLIRIAVARMPRLQGEVFLLSKEGGLTNEEIAEELNISRTAVSSHLYAARKTIRELMGLALAFFMIF